jgi:hypothetical protein
MSQVKTDRIWQHNFVLPYILNELKQKIEAITPIHTIYLTGSRDVLVVCDFPIINTAVWTRELNYHIDLIITNATKAEALLRNAQMAIELYPYNQLVI